MKKILITGATGFAGSYLTEYLAQSGAHICGTYLSDNSIHVLSDIRDKVELRKLDLLDSKATQSLIEELKPDEIYHLAALASAAQSFKNPTETITQNIASQINVLEAVRIANLQGCRILVTSSAEIYGQVHASDLPIHEETPLRPVSPYAVSKIAQDYLALQYFLTHALHIIRVRPFNHVGPRQSPVFVISSFAKQIAESEKSGNALLKVGNLDARRDFTDVRDMVRAYVLLMEKATLGDVYNIGSGISYRIGDILQSLISFATAEIKAQIEQERIRPIDVSDAYCDSTKMQKITGWKPEIDLEQTLRDTLEYWRGIV